MRKIPTTDSWTKAAKKAACEILLEKSSHEVDGREMVGRDPRKIDPSQFVEAGIAGAPILDVIRAKCLDCCGEQSDEVRKCTVITCANWPYRMGFNPFRRIEVTEIEREKRRQRGLALARRARDKRAGGS